MAPVSSGYTRIQIALHWAIALLILFQFVGSEAMEDFVSLVGITSASSSADIPVFARAHVLAGLLTFALMLIRVLMRFVKGAPALPEDEDPRLKMIAHATHGILYLALLLTPISGALAWFGQIEMADTVHLALQNVLMVFVGLHIAAALYHHFVLKNGLIKRMMKAA